MKELHYKATVDSLDDWLGSSGNNGMLCSNRLEVHTVYVVLCLVVSMEDLVSARRSAVVNGLTKIWQCWLGSFCF